MLFLAIYLTYAIWKDTYLHLEYKNLLGYNCLWIHYAVECFLSVVDCALNNFHGFMTKEEKNTPE